MNMQLGRAMKAGVVALAVLGSSQATGNAFAATSAGSSPEAIVRQTLGATSAALTAPAKAHGVTVSPARADGKVRSLTAPVPGGRAVVAVLSRGVEAVRFDLSLPARASLMLEPDGAVIVATPGADGGATAQAVIRPPWAKDAIGKALPTRYEIQGSTLIQHVDTQGAAFPVVADPSIVGFGYFPPATEVAYVQWSKSETRSLKDNATINGAIAAAFTACGSIPNNAAKALCAAVVTAKVSQFTSAVNYSVAHNQCLKARVPVGGVIPPPANSLYFYSHTC